jgi:hypothetical protein
VSDPAPDERLKLEALLSAVADACRSQWTIARLRGPEWLDIATAPTAAIRDALDAAWRIGCLAGIGCEECSCCKQLKPVWEIDGDPEAECASCREAHGRG